MVKLLIVDDEIYIRQGIRDSTDWEPLGITVCGLADCVPSALDSIALETPDIVVMDIHLPQVTGIELLEIINKKYPNIFVILISGYREFESAQAAVNLNAFAFLSKPIDMEEMRVALCRARDAIVARRAKLRQEAFIASKVKENVSFLRDDFLARLVNGKISSNEEIQSRASFLEIDLESGFFVSALILQDGGYNKAKSPDKEESENLFRATALSRMEQEFAESDAHFFNLTAGIGFLYGGASSGRDQLIRRFQEVIARINREAGFSLTVIVSKECARVEEIAPMFLLVKKTSDYRIMIGSNQVVLAEQFIGEEKSGDTPSIDFNLTLHGIEKELIFAAKNGDQESVLELIDRIVSAVMNIMETSMEQKRNVLFLLSSFLYKLQMEPGLFSDRPPTGADSIYAYLCAVGSQQELFDYLQSFLEEIRSEAEKRNQTQRNYLVDKAVSYIAQNIHSQISLVDMADRLHIHPSYLSKIFKAATGKSFTDYVGGAKMEEAKHLLQSSTMRIHEISQLLSYNDPGYFIKLFKRVYGVSPGEYRQM